VSTRRVNDKIDGVNRLDAGHDERIPSLAAFNRGPVRQAYGVRGMLGNPEQFSSGFRVGVDFQRPAESAFADPGRLDKAGQVINGARALWVVPQYAAPDIAGDRCL
jgi:hypothetical protein